MILQDKRIFIVEDTPAHSFLMMQLLRQHGAQVIVDNIAEGDPHLALRAGPLDAIILDYMLPGGGSGIDLFHALRELEAFQAIPCVMVSSADIGHLLPQVRAAGMNGLIPKPIQIADFPQQIARIIAGESVWPNH